MERFGPFELGRTLDSGGGATVYEARKEGDPKGKYVVKVFSPDRLVAEEAQEARSELDPLFRDLGASFTSRVTVQKQASERSRHFVPILAAGHEERGAWYASPFYARSVKGMLERFVALEGPDLFRIVHSVVRAALDLKKAAGRSHGNLKPANIFLAGLSKPRSSRVLVADPLPGGAEEAERYERADLRAVGELIYQLVFKRKVDFAWVIVPLESSPEWAKVFGKKTAGWLQLCNRLLDPGLSLDTLTLEALEKELRRLEPKPAVSIPTLAAAAGFLVLGGLAALLFLHKRDSGTLIVSTEPAGSRVILIPMDEDVEGLPQTNATVKGVLKTSLKKGVYKLRAEYPDSDLEPSRRVTVRVDAGRTVRTNLSLLYGGVVVLSDPPGAIFQLANRPAQTPFTNLFARPAADVEIQLRKDGFESTNLTVTIPSNHAVVTLVARLQRPPPGNGLVEFKTELPGIEILVDGQRRGIAPGLLSIPEGARQITAIYPRWAARTNWTMQVQTNNNPAQFVYFPFGTLSVTTSTPPIVQLFLTNQFVGLSPTNILLPPGEYRFSFRADGYKTNTQSIVITDHKTTSVAPALELMGGTLEFTSDPPGAEIRDPADRPLMRADATGGARLTLAPGIYHLKAVFPGLDPVWKSNLTVRAGQYTNIGAFRFQYGRLTFVNTQPEEIGTNVVVRRDDGGVIAFGQNVYQRPGARVGYRVEAADYDVWTNALSLEPGALTRVPVTLLRKRMPVELDSNLPEVRYSYVDEQKRLVDLGVGTNFHLPWGTYAFMARHANLAPLARTNVVPRSGSLRDEFSFADYGMVVTTNLLAGTEVFSAEAEGPVYQGRAPAPLYARPGQTRFLLVTQGYTNQTSTNVLRAAWVVLTSPLPLPYRSKTSGMEVVWVPGLPGTRAGGYVGKTHVTQAQYQKVMSSNPSSPAGENLPVNNVSAKDAIDFCQKLTELDRNDSAFPAGCGYTLLTVAQWEMLKTAADPNQAVYSVAGANRLKEPLPAGSKGADRNGLGDIYGNVHQICIGSAAGDFRTRGGSYNDTAVGYRYRFGDVFKDPSPLVGFRVVLIPSGP